MRDQNRLSDRWALFLPVYLPTFLLAFGQGMLVPTLPLYALTIQNSFGLASLLIAAAGIGTVLADVPCGILLDRIGRRRAMMVGTLAIALSTVGLAMTSDYGLLIACRLVAGVGTALWNISRMAYLAESTSSTTRGRSIATFGGINRVGTFAGPAIGGVIAAISSLQVSFLVTAALAVAAAVVSFLYIRDGSLGARKSKHMRWAILGQLARTHWKELLTAGSAQVFAQMLRQGRSTLVPLYAATVLGLSVAEVGSIVSLSSAIDMSLFIPAGMIMDRFGRKFAAVPSFAVMSIGMALIPFAHDYFGLAIAVSVIGVGNGLSSGTMFTLGADLAPPEATGEFLGLWRLIGDLGSTGGPVAVGGIADALGLEASAMVLAGIGMLSAVTLYLFVRETLEPAPAPAKSG
jgi:MFS family permease